jgi:predicted metal-dependent peptidase
MNENTDDIMKRLIAVLTLKGSYWGFLFSKVKRKADVSLPYAMAVATDIDETTILYYNPLFICEEDFASLEKIVQHEGIHLLNDHLPRLYRLLEMETDKDKKKFIEKIFGLAADCAANSLGRIPKIIQLKGIELALMHPERFNLPSLQSAEFYFFKLLEQAEKECQNQQMVCDGVRGDISNEDSGEGQSSSESSGESEKTSGSSGKDKDQVGQKQESKGQDNEKQNESSGQRQGKSSGKGNQNHKQADSKKSEAMGSASSIKNHDRWIDERVSDTSSFSRKAETFIQDIARESFRECQARGTVPGYISQMVETLLEPPKLPYYQIIRKLIRASRISKFVQSSTRINRKRTYVFAINDKHIPQISPFPGKMRDFTFNLGVLIDTSGSMPVSSIHEGLSGVKNVVENDRHCKTTVIENDVVIQKEYEVKRVTDIQPDIKGRGGTTLFPALARFKELKVDVVLGFTDGGCENINLIERKLLPRKIIWVITRGGSDHMLDKTGFVINLNGR